MPLRSRQQALGPPNLSAPDRFGIWVEDDRAITGHHMPASLNRFPLQLPGPPASVAEVDPEPTLIRARCDQPLEWLTLRREIHVRHDVMDVRRRGLRAQ